MLVTLINRKRNCANNFDRAKLFALPPQYDSPKTSFTDDIHATLNVVLQSLPNATKDFRSPVIPCTFVPNVLPRTFNVEPSGQSENILLRNIGKETPVDI